MWSARNVLDSLLWEAAHDDMGIYPRAVIRDGVEEPRTPWQDGWNAAVMSMTEKHSKFTKWVETLTDEQRDQLAEMLNSDGEPVILQLRDDTVKLMLFCSDTFSYACADGEHCELSDIPNLYRLWKAHGYYGIVAWIALKRKTEPVKEYRYEKGYLAAKTDV